MQAFFVAEGPAGIPEPLVALACRGVLQTVGGGAGKADVVPLCTQERPQGRCKGEVGLAFVPKPV